MLVKLFAIDADIVSRHRSRFLCGFQILSSSYVTDIDCKIQFTALSTWTYP